MIQKKNPLVRTACYYWAAHESNAQISRSKFFLRQKRQNGGWNSQRALHVPFPHNGANLWGGDGSFQVIWQTDLEVDLEQTKNYCVELVALYLQQMIKHSIQ